MSLWTWLNQPTLKQTLIRRELETERHNRKMEALLERELRALERMAEGRETAITAPDGQKDHT